MPNYGYNQGLYPAAPAAASGSLTDFDVQAAELARRRRLAELLQQQSMNTQFVNPRARGSILAPLASMFQAYMGNRGVEEANQQEQELQKQRSESLSKLIADMPTRDIPAQPENRPTEVEGEAVGPILPAQPGQTLSQQLLPWAAKLGQVGGKFGQGLGEEISKAALKNMLPVAGRGDYKIEKIYDKDTGREQMAYVSNVPGQPPIPIGGLKAEKDARDSALAEKTAAIRAAMDKDPQFDNMTPQQKDVAATYAASNVIKVTPDASGGATTTSTVGAAGQFATPGIPPVTLGGPPQSSPLPPPGTAPRPGRAPLGADEKILQQEMDTAASKNDVANYLAVAEERRARGMPVDPTIEPYLPRKNVPGVSQSTGSTAHIQKLENDTKALSEKMSGLQLPEIRTAIEQADAAITKLANEKRGGVEIKGGKPTGNVPGYGGVMGWSNFVPPLTTEGQEMKIAMQPITNIQARIRSGQAVTDNELARNLIELGQSLGMNDEAFWNAYSKVKERLASVESGVKAGYATPVVMNYEKNYSRGRGGEERTAPVAKQDIKAAVEASGIKYEPDLYDYRINDRGEVQRKRK